MIQDYGFGTIVGEETGDHPSLHASRFSLTLPNTGVSASVPKGYMVRVSGNTDLRGVVPDIKGKEYLGDEEDEILDTLLKLLESG